MYVIACEYLHVVVEPASPVKVRIMPSAVHSIMLARILWG